MNNKYQYYFLTAVAIFIAFVFGAVSNQKKLFSFKDKVKIDTIQTFEKSKYYKEWECWKYRRDTADYNRDYLADEYNTYLQNKFVFELNVTEPKGYIKNLNEQILADKNMERLKRLFRKDQSPCK